jgi:cation diffusion facilitator CzcD-associated flavoprotein CzcO
MLDTAIIGAGPYGLSIAAHFRRNGIPFRIFGRPMDNWRSHMPKGMMLKSDGFASNLYDPDNEFTLKDFCAERGIEYTDTTIPVGLDTFSAYGVAFQERMVPEVEDRYVVSVSRLSDGFSLELENGETVKARRVILAVGITHFEYVPAPLAHLPPEYVSHSFQHHELEPFKGCNVTVIGGGASAIGLAGLLREADCDSQLVVRESNLEFHSTPDGKPRSRWSRIRHPQSGLGPGLRSRFYADYPMLFRYLPERLRIEVVRRSLGPSGGWTTKEKVMGRVPLFLGYSARRAEIKNGKVNLHLRAQDGTEREVLTDHVIAGTGYRVDLNRLKFLSPEILQGIRAVDRTPVLSSTFESSVPGLYFVGIAAANSFGPVMRFAFGAGFAARRLTQTMLRSVSRNRASVAAPSVVTISK